MKSIKIYSITKLIRSSSCRYTIGLFFKGYKKELDVEDVYNPLNQDRSQLLGGRLQRQWDKEIKKSGNGKYDPSLIKALIRAYWLEGSFLGLLLIFSDIVIRIIQPQLLGGMLQYFSPGNTGTTKEQGLIYAGAMVVGNLFSMLLLNHYMLCCLHFGMKLRVASCAVVYAKVNY